MKRIIISVLVISGILLAMSPKVQAAVVLFLLVGAIPGTQLSVPPLVMLLGMAALLAFVLLWTRKQDFYTQARTRVKPPAVVQKVTTKTRAKRRLERQAQTA